MQTLTCSDVLIAEALVSDIAELRVIDLDLGDSVVGRGGLDPPTSA
jgi:hypothetical protein